MFRRTIFSIKHNNETKNSWQLEFYKKYFHRKGDDAITRPDYLKNT